MADPVQVKIKGIRQLESGMRELARNIEHASARDAVHPTAEQVAATVRARVPRKTGRLAASVHAVDIGKRSQVRLGEGLPYGTWIEFGAWGGRRGPRGGRYVYPTAKRTTRAFQKYAQTAVQSEIRGMRWPTPR